MLKCLSTKNLSNFSVSCQIVCWVTTNLCLKNDIKYNFFCNYFDVRLKTTDRKTRLPNKLAHRPRHFKT
jgi:hypothetical protein